MNTIQTLLPGLHPEQLTAIEAQVLAYYRTNLIRDIERLSPAALTQVSAVVSSNNELDFLLQVETTPEQPTQQSTQVLEQSTQVPEEPQQQLFNLPKEPTCQGCLENLENQMAHIDIGGCLAFQEMRSIFD